MARYNLDLADKLYEQVYQMAEANNTSAKQVIQEAVKAYLLLRGFQAEGSKLLVENNQGKIVELVLI